MKGEDGVLAGPKAKSCLNSLSSDSYSESVELNDNPEVSERNSIGNGIARHFVLASTGFKVLL